MTQETINTFILIALTMCALNSIIQEIRNFRKRKPVSSKIAKDNFPEYGEKIKQNIQKEIDYLESQNLELLQEIRNERNQNLRIFKIKRYNDNISLIKRLENIIQR